MRNFACHTAAVPVKHMLCRIEFNGLGKLRNGLVPFLLSKVGVATLFRCQSLQKQLQRNAGLIHPHFFRVWHKRTSLPRIFSGVHCPVGQVCVVGRVEGVAWPSRAALMRCRRVITNEQVILHAFEVECNSYSSVYNTCEHKLMSFATGFELLCSGELRVITNICCHMLQPPLPPPILTPDSELTIDVTKFNKGSTQYIADILDGEVW